MKRLVVLLALLPVACDPFSTTNESVDQGLEHYEATQYAEAQEQFEAAREEIPERAELFFDLGTSQLAQEQWEDAEVSFTRALETAGTQLRPVVLANLGLARLHKALGMEDSADRTQALAKALEAFEKALELRPDLRMAQHNMELTLLHLFPPCSKRDDRFEPNDNAAKATPMEELEKEPADLLLCPGNADMYTLPLEQGDRLTLTLEQRVGAEDAKAVAPPAMRLLDPAGAIVAEGTVDGLTNVIEHTAHSAGTYRAEITESDEEEHPYALTREVLPACSKLQDEFEPNDTRQSAADLDVHAPPPQQGQPGQQPPAGTAIRICPDDSDWFRFQLNAYESILVQVAYEPLAGALGFELVDEAGNVVATGKAGKQEEGDSGKRSLMASHLDVREATTLYLHVFGTTGEAESPAEIHTVVRPPCPEGDDDFEENDDRDSAHEFEMAPPADPAGAGQAPAASAQADAAQAQPIQHLLRRCPGDDDWFALKLEKDQSVQAQIAFDHAKGDLALEAWRGDNDAPEARSDESSDTQPGEGVGITAAEAGTYYLRVTGGAGVTNFYQLDIRPPQPQQGDNQQDQQDQQDQEPKDDEQQKEERQQEQTKQEQQEPKKPIEQMMDQLDRQEQPNLEAERALRRMPNAQAPQGKPW